MNWKIELKVFAWMAGLFILVYFMPLGWERFDRSIMESLELLKWYAREHVILCLIPAFLIAGVIAVFISQEAVVKYFGARAVKWKSYMVASVSGAVLAVCSCTILPLFSSIHKRGAGIGPAVTFLYSGPAINILAIILTARILGWQLGLARVIGAVVFSVIIGLVMAYIFRKDQDGEKTFETKQAGVIEEKPMWQTALFFLILVFIMIVVNWGEPRSSSGFWYWIWAYKWHITAGFAVLLGITATKFLGIKWYLVLTVALAIILSIIIFPDQPLVAFLTGVTGTVVISLATPGDPNLWIQESWWFTKQILPLLASGVLVAGLLLGTSAGGGIIPQQWISMLVGGNTIGANLFASIFGAFMYFATLTEVPIIQALVNNGMGQGPALALLLAGPALSLPNMLVIQRVMGTKKTVVYILLVIIMASISGLLFGSVV